MRDKTVTVSSREFRPRQLVYVRCRVVEIWAGKEHEFVLEPIGMDKRPPVFGFGPISVHESTITLPNEIRKKILDDIRSSP